ncbi:UDP-2,3-diacylglucosamine diphosphatase [Runella sp.]|jgi:UDP-2,3-diacylglucosamine hydrolase|uniref:UDP-2,3-diacylglucosamine diphosphatase n=1 Tax=Runella sp. TaxID=1960881 RepID=UPI0026388036|nr:UDP-2,3-diacylglucosamine diphosphatase [Runella sp.]
MSFQQLEVTLLPEKKIYFASDFHLGAPNHTESLKRERRLVRWLESIRHDAQMICLVGDLFDFWYEHKRVVPRGFVRFLGKLGELTDAGIEIIVFPGNHDMWMTDYFEKELNIKTFRRPLEFTVHSSQSKVYSLQFTENPEQSTTQTINILIAHGDGLGPGDYNYKLLQKVFESKLARWAFGNLMHPDWALWLGQSWAQHSWKKHDKEAQPVFLGEDKEWLLLYAKEEESKKHRDFYIFGHRHIEFDQAVNSESRMLILGDWINYNTFAVFDGTAMALKNYIEY